MHVNGNREGVRVTRGVGVNNLQPMGDFSDIRVRNQGTEGGGKCLEIN